MQYEVEVGGKLRQVSVARAAGPGGGFAVTIDGQTRHVDAARIDAQTLSLLVDGVAPNAAIRSYEMTLAADAVGALTVGVGATPVAVTVNGRRRWGRKEDAAGGGSGPRRVIAPMPGKVVRLLVKPGDTVTARQPVVVVEAMKMENELRAGREGVVTEVHAREGLSVEAGTLLVVIQ
jgi:biotin carboxyl carrier protein